MQRKLLFFCGVVLLLTCACAANPSGEAHSGSRSEASASEAFSKDAEATPFGATGEKEMTQEQVLYDDYFATEHRWPQTKISGDSLESSMQNSPYEYNLAYLYFIQEDGSVMRAIAKRDQTIGNWRAQEAEKIDSDLKAITEIATLDGEVVPQDTGRPFFIEEGKRIIDTDVNCQDRNVNYESTEKLSQLQVGNELLFFLENETTLCRLHRASGIVDKWKLPSEMINHYTVITSEAIIWESYTAEIAGIVEDSESTERLPSDFSNPSKFLLNCKTGKNRKIEARDYDRDGLLIYK